MKILQTLASLLIATLCLFPAFAQCQTVVDATRAARQLKRQPQSMRGGNAGVRAFLQVKVLAGIGQPDAEGKTPVEFVLTNSSAKPLIIPISPNPGDLEPEDPQMSYGMESLTLYISHADKPGHLLKGGAFLYGSASVPSSLITLEPGGTVRVLARVQLPAEEPNSVETYSASVLLSHDSYQVVRGVLTLNSTDTGFAVSHAFFLDALRPLAATEVPLAKKPVVAPQ